MSQVTLATAQTYTVPCVSRDLNQSSVQTSHTMTCVKLTPPTPKFSHHIPWCIWGWPHLHTKFSCHIPWHMWNLSHLRWPNGTWLIPWWKCCRWKGLFLEKSSIVRTEGRVRLTGPTLLSMETERFTCYTLPSHLQGLVKGVRETLDEGELSSFANSCFFVITTTK